MGTKMWPLSSPKLPKHFLPILEDKSLFRLNCDVLEKKFKPEEIYISTNVSQVELVKLQAPEISEKNFIIEPEMRNTGPAIGLIVAKLFSYFPDEPFMIVQADILRKPEEKFLEMIDSFDRLIKNDDGKWITGAIKAPFAMMGVDYMISENESLLCDWLIGKDKVEIEQYIKNGKAWLHANHYCWTPKKWLASYLRLKPEWGKPLMQIAEGGSIEEIYPQIPKGRTEDWTALSVKDGEGVMNKLPFEWWDFGTWESLEKYYLANGTAPKNGGLIEIEAKNNFCISESKKKIAILGLDNVIVVEGDNGVLVCRRDLSGRVGEVV